MIGKRVFGVLLGTVMTGAALTAPAQAAGWAGSSMAGVRYEVCTNARTHNKVAYAVCIQHNAGHTKTRVAIRISVHARRSVAGTATLRVPGRSHNVSTRSCSGTLANGAKRQCATGWLNSNRIVQSGDASIRIAGSRRPNVQLKTMRLSGKKQESSAKYCGPAAVQAALRTIKGSAPSQDTLANSSNLQTNRYGFTLPARLDNALNRYKPSSVSGYKVYDFGSVGQSTELGFRQLYRSIAAGNPVVYLVDPSRLPWSSNPAGTSVRHYILLYGYSAYRTTIDTNLNGGWIADRFAAWDPASGSVHQITGIQLLNATQGSQYIDDDMVFAAK